MIGPNADKPANQLGDYTAPQRPGQTVTPRMGFEVLGKRLGFEVVYAKGCAVRSQDKSGFAAALAVAKSSDAVVLCLGGCSVADRPLRQNAAGTAIAGGDAQDGDLPDKDAGEGFDRATLRLGGVQLDLLREIRALGKPVVTVLILGRPLVLDEVARRRRAYGEGRQVCAGLTWSVSSSTPTSAAIRMTLLRSSISCANLAVNFWASRP